MNFNDPNIADESSNPPAEGDKPHDEITMPLGVGDFADGARIDPLATSGSRRKLQTGSLVLVVVVILAVAGLFSMRTLAKVTAAVSGSNEFEAIIDGFFQKEVGAHVRADAVDKSDETVLKVLNEPYTEHQVPLVNVQKNPFIVFAPPVMPAARPTLDGNDAVDETVKQWERHRAERRTVFEEAATYLEVKSILLGGKPLANVNGRVVHVGGTITAGPEKTEFTVTEITASAVILQASAPEYDLTYERTLHIHRSK